MAKPTRVELVAALEVAERERDELARRLADLETEGAEVPVTLRADAVNEERLDELLVERAVLRALVVRLTTIDTDTERT
jgi:hypothetical protein